MPFDHQKKIEIQIIVEIRITMLLESNGHNWDCGMMLSFKLFSVRQLYKVPVSHLNIALRILLIILSPKIGLCYPVGAQ